MSFYMNLGCIWDFLFFDLSFDLFLGSEGEKGLVVLVEDEWIVVGGGIGRKYNYFIKGGAGLEISF